MGKYGRVLPKCWGIFTVKWQEKGAPEGAPERGGRALFFAGEDSSTEGGNGHEGHGRGDHIIGAGGGVLLGLGLGGVLGAVGDDDDGAAGGGLNEAVTNYRVFIANLAPIIIGHGNFHTFRQGSSLDDLAIASTAIDGGIIADGDGGTHTNIIKADDAVADILKGIAGDDNIAVVASF